MATIETYKRELSRLILEREDQKIILKLISFSKGAISNDEEFCSFTKRQEEKMQELSKKVKNVSELIDTLQVIIEQQNSIDMEIRNNLPGQTTAELYKTYVQIEEHKLILQQKIEILF